MSDGSSAKISFEVETSRILEILSKEIYDSPLALLRENLQNAYDAVLMRGTAQQREPSDAEIIVTVEPLRLTIADNGIGMTELVLRNNFWKAGSSGKRTELARQSGVIGTFGIGAMANFGVCTKLRVETRSIESNETLISTAERSKLSISKECIDLERSEDDRLAGTRLIVDLEPSSPLAETTARAYLQPYVGYIPVKVLLNNRLISQKSYLSAVGGSGYTLRVTRAMNVGPYAAELSVYTDANGQVVAHLQNVKLQGVNVVGELVLVQNGGQLMGLRNYFGLAPIPVSGVYSLGGTVNLSILQPTAGREALSRESIEHVSRLIALAEKGITESLAETDFADKNVAFLQYVVSNNRFDLARPITVEVLPASQSVPLGRVIEHCKGKSVFYYGGRDQAILQTFAHDQSYLLHVSQSNPRRQLQLKYIKDVLRVAEVPDRATILREYAGTDLSLEEASLLIRVASTLADDYLLPNVNVSFADISHGVSVLVSKEVEGVHVRLSRTSGAVLPVLASYHTAHEVFGGFVKDFVRNHLYQKLSQYVPSTTREGVDALAKLLQRNRELYRYEESELGDLEPLLGDYLSGEKTLAQVLVTARSTGRPQTQTVRRDKVGSLEQALPDVVDSPTTVEGPTPGQELEAQPPILRTDVACDLKILVTNKQHRQLNNFELFLGLSDRLMKREGDFFRWPHTTKIIWGGHRVVYIFTESSQRITLYYDIELQEPLQEEAAGGGMFPTTTLITNDRIYVPVPPILESAFRIVEGAKEFFVRFDTISA